MHKTLACALFTLLSSAGLMIAGGIGPTASAQPPGPASCPMMLEGTEVQIHDIEEGVAVTYTTARSEDVQALRERVRAMAERREQRAASRRGHGARALPPATFSVTDVPDGAQLELRAVDPADVEALRERVAMRAARMGSGGCPMMEEAPA